MLEIHPRVFEKLHFFDLTDFLSERRNDHINDLLNHAMPYSFLASSGFALLNSSSIEYSMKRFSTIVMSPLKLIPTHRLDVMVVCEPLIQGTNPLSPFYIFE